MSRSEKQRKNKRGKSLKWSTACYKSAFLEHYKSFISKVSREQLKHQDIDDVRDYFQEYHPELSTSMHYFLPTSEDKHAIDAIYIKRLVKLCTSKLNTILEENEKKIVRRTDKTVEAIKTELLERAMRATND